MHYDHRDMEKLRDLPIEGVAERLGLTVTRHKALCPFHSDHSPSLSFKVSKNMFRCFVCGASGGPIDLVMKYLNVGFLEACRWLEDENNVNITKCNHVKIEHPESEQFDASRYERYFERPWLNEEARRFLFEERRLDERVVRWCRLTSWKDRRGTPWLQTPYYDRECRLVGIQNRNLIPGGSPRFRFPQGSSCTIYNLPVLNLLKPGDELWITEGCSDCWAMLSAGHKAIAIPSATLLKRRDIELLLALCQPSQNGGRQLDSQPPIAQPPIAQPPISLHMYPDRDEPGERLFMQLKERLPQLEHHQLPPGCKDFSDYYLSAR